MTISPAEKEARAALPFVRFINAYLPLPISRWLIRLGVDRVKLPAGITRQAVSADSVPCEWLIPDGSPPDKALVYFHGGGFVYGVTSLHLEMVSALALKMGVRALMVDYRVAPQHPFPAPLDDCVTAYRWVLKQGFPAKNVVMAGDSAGGNLTLTTLMTQRDSGGALPEAAASLSAVGSFAAERGGLWEKARDPLLHPRAAQTYNRAYVADNDPRNPLISPVFGDWRGLPPILFHCGEDEVLREDSVEMAALAHEAGVTTRLEIYPTMWHVWQIYLKMPQAQHSLDDIAQFLRQHLDKV